MYSTCIFCDRSLGANEVIEAFPVGRRLAFDSHQGRLWVVCGSCKRWNLSPLEERWEAVEECEILFRSLPTRVHSKEIGVAKHPEGLHLVRIGDPVPVEFAVCRYGETMGRRYRRNAYYVAAGAAATGAILVGGIIVGFAGIGLLAQTPTLIESARVWATRVSVRLPDGTIQKVHAGQVDFLNPDEESAMGLRIRMKKKNTVALYGAEARRVASKMVPLVNRSGARLNAVEEAVTMLSEVGGPDNFLRETWGKGKPRPGSPIGWTLTLDRKGAMLGALTPTSRIALEMALHEEQERKALEGELTELRAAWRSAEELAQISDNLLLSPELEEQMDDLRERSRTDGLE